MSTTSSVDDTVVYVGWDGPNDPANPLNFSKTRKWILSSIGFAFMTLVGAAISAYAISQPSLEEALDISHLAGTFGVVIFTFAFGTAPLVVAPFSELFGRLPVYIVSAIIFWTMFVPQALAKNVAGVLVPRFVSGIGASTSIAVVGGTLADMFESHERGFPMAVFSFVAFAGTGLGPVCFGYMELKLGYKFINWSFFGLSGLLTLVLVPVCKETRASVLLIRKAARLRADTGDLRYRAKAEEERSSLKKMIKESLFRPLRLLFTEPALFAFTIWMTYAWGILYLMLESIPLVFTELYDFNAGESGLVFAGQIVGPIAGMAVNVWCDRLYARNVARKGPEARLYIAMFSGIFLPLGCWMYTWTSWSSVHWIAPVIGICIIYASMFGVYVACFNYIADSYTTYASSALGGQSALRLVISAMFSLVAEPMYDRLGIHVAGTVLAALSTLFAITPFILYKYGAEIRSRSPFAKQLAVMEKAECEMSEEPKTA